MQVPLRRGIALVRNYLQFRPQRGFRPHVVVDGRLRSDAMAAELAARGICIVPGLLEGADLSRVRASFDAVFTGPGGIPRGATSVPGTFSRIVDAPDAVALVELALKEVVLAAVEAYYRRPIYLAAVQANRLEPVAPFEGDSYQWHHDSKGKYVKAMWCLTDVTSDGQRMSYIAGSHRPVRVARSYDESRVSDRAARAEGEVVECAGPAGTLVLFDTNGIHRGNRNMNGRRDVVFGVYSAGEHLHGCRTEPGLMDRLTPWQREIVLRSERPSDGYERSVLE